MKDISTNLFAWQLFNIVLGVAILLVVYLIVKRLMRYSVKRN